jgi:hypothetical protein
MGHTIFKTLRFLSLVVVIGMLGAGASSCNKDTTCKGDIFVVDKAQGKPVVGASVHSYYSKVDNTQLTDASGKVHLQLNLPAILTIDVTPPAPTTPPLYTPPLGPGSTILKFDIGTTNSVTVKL